MKRRQLKEGPPTNEELARARKVLEGNTDSRGGRPRVRGALAATGILAMGGVVVGPGVVAPHILEIGAQSERDALVPGIVSTAERVADRVLELEYGRAIEVDSEGKFRLVGGTVRRDGVADTYISGRSEDRELILSLGVDSDRNGVSEQHVVVTYRLGADSLLESLRPDEEVPLSAAKTEIVQAELGGMTVHRNLNDGSNGSWSSVRMDHSPQGTSVLSSNYPSPGGVDVEALLRSVDVILEATAE